jgi:tetratricopeptide (TPR) repeat protein
LRTRLTILVIGLALVLITVLAFLPVSRHQFVAIDDQAYVTENPRVVAGVTVDGVLWAFRTGHASNWHPLTWLSHMVDCQLYGLQPGGHHLTNVALHALNALLLFLLLGKMTGRLWRSAFVAALFAWHPLHVESVAWVSERKDVLSTLFFILTLWAYLRYTRATPLRLRYYLGALGLFALGLMSKPMLVTLPCVLLLLDYWPLGRWPGTPARTLVKEKLPFFALALLDGVVTCLVQRGAAASLASVPFGTRLANAVLAYARYLGDTFWPTRLAAMYPYSRSLPLLAVGGAVLLLAGLTALALWRARKQPYLIVGWLWFLGTLAPTIGLIQVGAQSMADRYMYIPSIGLFVALTWGMVEGCAFLRRQEPLAVAGMVAGMVALAACLVLTRAQLATWANSERLFRHAIEVMPGNCIAWDGLGTYYSETGKREEARKCYAKAIQINSHYAQAQYDMGTLLLEDGKTDDAIPYLSAALRDEPEFARAHINLGKILLERGKLDDAAGHMAAAVRSTPDDPEAHYNLGTVLMRQSQMDEAAACFNEALRLRPRYAAAHGNIGIILMGKGDVGGGISHFIEASRLEPSNPDAHVNLGLAYFQGKQPADATNQFFQALKLNPESARAHYELATVLVQTKNPAEAADHARRSGELAAKNGDTALAEKSAELLKSLETAPAAGK